MGNNKIKTKNSDGTISEIEVNFDVQAFDKENFWKEDWQERKARQRNSYEQLCEIYERGKLPDNLAVESCEEAYIKKYDREILWKAIDSLSEKRKRRLMYYFFDELVTLDIAIAENVSIRAVEYSIRDALENLKKFLEKFNF